MYTRMEEIEQLDAKKKDYRGNRDAGNTETLSHSPSVPTISSPS